MVKNSVLIRVPASSANIGCGFDSFGLALCIYNRYEVQKREDGKREIIWKAEKLVCDSENLVTNTMDDELKRRGFSDLGYRLIMCEQEIPVSRGLGSSAAAIVAGLMGAMWLCDREYDEQYLLYRSSLLEGHPDNCSAAILGDFCVSKLVDHRVLYHRIPFFKDVKILLMIPHQELKTKESRLVMPKEYFLKDVVHNISNASFLISSLYQNDKNAFALALEDRIHVPYRLPLIEDAEKVMEFVKKMETNCLGITISGAGSALIGFFADIYNSFDREQSSLGSFEQLRKKCQERFQDWSFLELNIDGRGAIYE